MYKLNELALVVLCQLACVAGGSSVNALRRRSCEAARRIGKRQFFHAFGVRFSQLRRKNTYAHIQSIPPAAQAMSVTRKIVLLSSQAIFRIEVKFDKLSFCTFLYKTCFQITRVTISCDPFKKYIRPNVFKVKSAISIVIVVSRRIRLYAGIVVLNIQLAITFLFPLQFVSKALVKIHNTGEKKENKS